MMLSGMSISLYNVVDLFSEDGNPLFWKVYHYNNTNCKILFVNTSNFLKFPRSVNVFLELLHLSSSAFYSNHVSVKPTSIYIYAFLTVSTQEHRCFDNHTERNCSKLFKDEVQNSPSVFIGNTWSKVNVS